MKAEKFTLLRLKTQALRYFMLAIMLIGSYTSYAQCPLSCNDNLQISLDDHCGAKILPDMIMEGDIPASCTNSYRIVISDKDDNVIEYLNSSNVLVTDSITGNEIGKTLKVTVYLNGTKNSCWSTISVEDKLPPVIICRPDITVSCNQPYDVDYRDFVLPKYIVSENCAISSTFEVRILSDELNDHGCFEDGFSAVRSVRYVVLDESGNRSKECTFNVKYRRDQIVEWGDRLVQFECGTDSIQYWEKDILTGYGIPDPLDSGGPTISGNSIFPNIGYCEIQATYTDEFIPLCGNTYKVLRKWTVLDWCTSTVSENYQIIKVEDSNPPIITDPATEFFVFANPYSCDATIRIPFPDSTVVIEECSYFKDMDIELFYKVRDETGDRFTNNIKAPLDSDGKGWSFTPMTRDSVWLVYVYTDECGYATESFNEVVIKDDIPPITICDEFTVVTLSNANSTWVRAKSFDDGSFDNCTDQDSLKFEVLRFRGGYNCDGYEVLDSFAEHIEFCCKDVMSDTLMVILRVTDMSGNMSTCMVSVDVQDKEKPVITYCPPDITVNCGSSTEPIDLFVDNLGFATATDNCAGAEIRHGDRGTLNQCGVGTINRTWSTGMGNDVVSCRQRITIEREREVQITWPRDKTITTDCEITDADLGEPILSDDDECYLTASTFTDKKFDFVEDVCQKIIRSWVVIDWCIYNDGKDLDQDGRPDGYYEYEQIIKYINNDKPYKTDTKCTRVEIIRYFDDCSAEVDLFANIEDKCTDFFDLKFTYEIDLGNDGTIDLTGNTGEIMLPNVPLGFHHIKWFVEDNCGNSLVCEEVLNIPDTKQPTPYCLGGVTTVIMPSTGNVEVWASDFDHGSFDNCPGELRFTMRLEGSNGAKRSNYTFYCSEAGTHDVEIWVTDAAGNSDYCITKIDIQANEDCDDGSFMVNVGGRVITENEDIFEGVKIRMIDAESLEEKVKITNEEGKFEFQDVNTSNSYNLSASNNSDFLNGVSTLDIILTQRHILGLQEIESKYKLIAADVNNNGAITSSDIVETRKLILGITDKYSNNTSWKFLNKDEDSANSENISLSFMRGDVMDNKFIAIKVGDINGSAEANANGNVEDRSIAMLSFELRNSAFTVNEEIRIPIYMKELQYMSGFQTTVEFDNTTMKFDRIENGQISIVESNVNKSLTHKGLIAMSWNGNSTGIEIDNTEPLFYIVATALTSGESKNLIELNSKMINTEVYDDDLNVYELNITTRHNNIDIENNVSLFQNVPNPFTNSTQIGFYLPKENDAEITVFDITGKQIYNISNHYGKGYNEVSLDKSKIQTNGVLYYQLNVDGYKVTKRMIMIE